VVLREIGLNEFGERQRARNPPLVPEALEFTIEPICRILVRRGVASLYAARAMAREP
jgi:hypothetical protein